MSHTTDESDDGVRFVDQTDSLSIEEGSSGGSINGIVLKKGPWTSAEDAILIDYVKKHGEGNWNAVQKQTGLLRCGKSCRLRWANHLRPNLKKGAFTAEEERIIIELHAKMGNKWARMAAHLPGRTDNEIKNYWNTRIKRRQRAGLPLYPPDVCLQARNDGKQNTAYGEQRSVDTRCHDLISSNLDIPDVVFDNLKADSGTLPYVPSYSDVYLGNMLNHAPIQAQSYSLMSKVEPRVKQENKQNLCFPFFSSNTSNYFKQVPEIHDKIQSCSLVHSHGTMYGFGAANKSVPAYDGTVSGSHALLNGNFSASQLPMEVGKLELPSFQYPLSDLSMWECPPPPSLDPLDAYVQSPQMQSDTLRNCGLLEALLHESQTLGSGNNHASEKSSGSSTSAVTPDAINGSRRNVSEPDWEEFTNSPLVHSAASSFSDCTSIGRTPLDEPLVKKPFTGTGQSAASSFSDCTSIGCRPLNEPLHKRAFTEVKELNKQYSKQDLLDFSRPDALLNANWLDFDYAGKNMKDFLGNFYNDYHLVDGISGPRTANGFGPSYCAWNRLPSICQMSKLS